MILVIDVGTTGLRAAVVRPDGGLANMEYRPTPPSSPIPGLVEFDPVHLAEVALDAATTVLHRLGSPPITGVGIACQRASTILWERATGRPVGPGLGWQDLRTVGECLTVGAEHGLRLAPNQSATKLAWLLAQAGDRSPDELCFGTIDTWLAWTLSQGALHVTDPTNGAVTGLWSIEANGWDLDICEILGIDPIVLPTVVDTFGVVGEAAALPDCPPLAAIVGDQQGSLVGQGCLAPGDAKFTAGTGGMLDVCSGDVAPTEAIRSPQGTFPIITRSHDGTPSWGAEGIMLSAGSAVDWLCADLGVIATPADSEALAAECTDTGGVVFVPALLGLGTPEWDYGARGTLLGVTRGTGRAEVTRAVLEGIAQRGADLVAAAESDTGVEISRLRVDGGMSRNRVFVQAFADATGRPVDVSPIVDATTLGAGFLAGTATGIWDDLAAAVATVAPSASFEPTDARDRAGAERDRWRRAVERSRQWYPELSALDF